MPCAKALLAAIALVIVTLTCAKGLECSQPHCWELPQVRGSPRLFFSPGPSYVHGPLVAPTTFRLAGDKVQAVRSPQICSQFPSLILPHGCFNHLLFIPLVSQEGYPGSQEDGSTCTTSHVTDEINSSLWSHATALGRKRLHSTQGHPGAALRTEGTTRGCER